MVPFHKRLPIEKPALSPDLDWMLFGFQASPVFVLETLVREYYQPLLRLSSAAIGEDCLSQKIVQECFAHIVTSCNRKGSSIGALGYVYAIAIDCILESLLDRTSLYPRNFLIRSTSDDSVNEEHEREFQDADIWGAFDGLDARTRIVLIMKFIDGFSSETIANILSLDRAEVASLLDNANRWLLDQMGEPLADLKSFELTLSKSLNRRWPLPEFNESELNGIIKSVIRKYEQNRQKENRRNALKMAGIIGAFLLVALAGFLKVDGIINKHPPPDVSNTALGSTQSAITLPPFPEISGLLSGDTDINVISDRFASNHLYWKTAWLDVFVYWYGPPGYAGSPVIRHEQIWFTRGGDILLLSGPMNGEVDRIWLATEGREYYANSEQNRIIVHSSDPAQQESSNYPYQVNSRLIFEVDTLAQEHQEVVIGDASIAERETLILDLFPENGLLKYRLWVDVSTGLALRLLSFAEDGRTITGEILIVRVIYDVDLPTRIFDTSFPVTHFVDDYRAINIAKTRNYPGYAPGSDGHARLPRISPPAGFDPTRDDLRLEWFKLAGDGSLRIETTLVGIYSGKYFLGHAVVENPWSASCSRSPDGRYLAIKGPSKQIWLDITSELESHEPLPAGSTYGDIAAFSPDSHFMAFWGCALKENNCGVYILDLRTNELRKLQVGEYPSNLIWRPDGKELLFVRGEEILILQLDPIKTVYRAELDRTGNLPLDLPASQWGVNIDQLHGKTPNCSFLERQYN